MHDSLLLHKIAAAFGKICEENNLAKVKETIILVSYNSHIESKDLHEHLLEIIPERIDNSTIINIKKADIEDQTAVIYMLKGEGTDAN